MDSAFKPARPQRARTNSSANIACQLVILLVEVEGSGMARHDLLRHPHELGSVFGGARLGAPAPPASLSDLSVFRPPKGIRSPWSTTPTASENTSGALVDEHAVICSPGRHSPTVPLARHNALLAEAALAMPKSQNCSPRQCVHVMLVGLITRWSTRSH